MTVTRQYLAVKFDPADRRAYTYHHDGAPIAKGAVVRVPGRNNGEAKVTVVEVTDKAPGFPTKPILGPVTPTLL